MPIDPRIPLSALGGSPQQVDVAGTIYRAQAAHAMQAEAQRKAAEAAKQQQIDALASQYDDPEDYIQAVSRIDPLAARKFGEQYQKHKNEKLEGHKRALEVDGKKLDYYMRILPDDPDEYAIWRQSIVTKSPEFDFLPQPEQWAADPAVRQSVRRMGLTAAEQNKAEQEATKFLLEGKPHEGLARVLKDAPTLDVARNYLTETKGIVPKAVRQFYEGIIATSPSWDVARQRIAQAGLSSKETADIEAKAVDDARQAAKAVTDLAHQQEQERIARGQLAVSQGQLGVARGNLQQRIADANKPGAAEGTPAVKLSAGQQSDLETMLTASDMAQQVLTLGNKIGWKGVGAFKTGSISEFGAKLGYSTDEERSLRNNISNIQATIAKLRGGASFTPSEQAMLDRYTPTIERLGC